MRRKAGPKGGSFFDPSSIDDSMDFLGPLQTLPLPFSSTPTSMYLVDLLNPAQLYVSACRSNFILKYYLEKAYGSLVHVVRSPWFAK